MTYICQFTGTKRKWVNGVGWIKTNKCFSWQRSFMTETQVKRLPYYKQEQEK